MQRIEILPLSKIAQNPYLMNPNPQVRIFKIIDNTIHEQPIIPINPKHLNINRYERHEVNKSNYIPEAGVAFFVLPALMHQRLSPELHKFDYVYS